MIIYENDAHGFRRDVERNKVVENIEETFREKLGRSVADNERRSWRNSLSHMETIVRLSGVSSDCGVLIEYMLPNSSQRVDFVITGRDDENQKNFVIIELKQWERAEKTDMDGVVETVFGGGIAETTHPSYQAYTYRDFMEDFHSAVADGNLTPYSCAYLHNYKENTPEPLRSSLYSQKVEEAPLFFKDDTEKLQDFIKRHVGNGDGLDILYEIKNGKIIPSKKLIDHVSEMFEGNEAFTLLDDQKVVFEKAKKEAMKSDRKSVVIVKGGPGTGKSVISVNLFGELLQGNQNTIFVGPNAAFREAIIEKLAKDRTKTRVKKLFKGSSSFHDTEEDLFDTIVVDEAHRLKDEKAFMYKGENQVEDIVKAAKTAIFFIDDRQSIRPEDIGSVDEIKRVAKKYDTEIKEYELATQFRCSGAEGYVNWLDDVLHIRQTANYDGWGEEDFEFRIFETPNDLRDAIFEKAEEGYKARLLAGYAWPWTSEKKGNPDAEIDDIKIPEYDFEMPWNSRKYRKSWAIREEGLNQVGCIHTVQGLEFEYVGVIVGDDLKFDEEDLEYDTEWSSYKDKAGKKRLKDKPEELNEYVRKIYKILLSRGMKGCYVYFQDESVENYFRDRLNS